MQSRVGKVTAGFLSLWSCGSMVGSLGLGLREKQMKAVKLLKFNCLMFCMGSSPCCVYRRVVTVGKEQKSPLSPSLEVPTPCVSNGTIVFVPVTHFLGLMMCKHISSLQCFNSVQYYRRLF